MLSSQTCGALLQTSKLPLIGLTRSVLQDLHLLPRHAHNNNMLALCPLNKRRDWPFGIRGRELWNSLPLSIGGLRNRRACRWPRDLLLKKRQVTIGGVRRLIVRAVNMELLPQSRLTLLLPSTDSHHICDRWFCCLLGLSPIRGGEDDGEEGEGRSRSGR